jgi:hypothetical protein
VTATELLAECRQRGIELTVTGDRLQYKAPLHELSPALKEALHQQKASLIALLRTDGRARTAHPQTLAEGKSPSPSEAPAVGQPEPASATPDGLPAVLRAPKPGPGSTGVGRSASCATSPSLTAGPRPSQCSGPTDAQPAAETLPRPVLTWDSATSDLIHWFQTQRDHLPQEPFALHPWVRVDVPATFYAALALDIAAGPRGARARTGALAADLRRLWELYQAVDQKLSAPTGNPDDCASRTAGEPPHAHTSWDPT